MKTVWIACTLGLASAGAFAQSTIYKHVDESGRVTYSNRPFKGAQVVDLEPLTTIPGSPGPGPATAAAPAMPPPPVATKPLAQPASLVVVKPETRNTAEKAPRTAVAIMQPPVEYLKREDDKRVTLESDLARAEKELAAARAALAQEQQNPTLIAAVRAAQQATDPTPAQLAEFRNNIDKASGRIRGLQATVAENERAVEAIRKDLAALK